MKKITTALLIYISILCTSETMAQGVSNFAFGPKVGANYSQFISPVDVVRGEPALGYQAGLFGRISLGSFYIQPEAYYSLRGGRVRFWERLGEGLESVTEDRINVNNIDVPVLVGFKLINQPSFNLRVLGGPVANFTLNINDGDLSELSNFIRDYASNTWGIQAGIGADIGNFTIDARYETGLSDINRSYDLRASIFQLSVGLNIL